MNWSDLDYWNTGEYQVVEERLKDLTLAKTAWCPGPKNVFRAMDLVPFDKVKVCLVGQDPYPNSGHACGLAFSVSEETKVFPITLKRLFAEYMSDLHQPEPKDGDLTTWCDEGVFLWNAIPSCEEHKSLSHNWPEWRMLTEEIITKLSNSGQYIVFIFLGGVAREFAKLVNTNECDVIETSHPSPRGSLNSKTPFEGSRIFTRTNDLLVSHGKGMIDWRL